MLLDLDVLVDVGVYVSWMATPPLLPCDEEMRLS
jgi:hypothetical protein